MEKNSIPEFAILGHPNEGKSSVVSTLSEDDSVKISTIPGETVECRDFPVVIDGKVVIRFIDTPGFQTPQKALAWMKGFNGPGEQLIKTFREVHKGNVIFKDECELLMPLSRGAGIIYVVDGSRPMRKADKAEMEILRLTGLPRMAIINCKQEEDEYLDEWKQEFRKHFNSIRVFNAHRATYLERIALLESLKSIDQDWQEALETVILTFKQDWEQRCTRTAEVICDFIASCLLHTSQEKYKEEAEAREVERRLENRYKKDVKAIEKKAFGNIKKLYKHNIFNMDLPDQSLVKEDLFSTKTWQVLGLTPLQLAAATGIAGSILGAGIDIAAGGITFGVFTILGGAAGAGSALFGKKVAKKKIAGITIGNTVQKIGPNENIQFLYVLLDRVLIYYSHIINWAHSRRELPEQMTRNAYDKHIKKGYTAKWNRAQKNICSRFFKDIRSTDPEKIEKIKAQFIVSLKEVLLEISKT